MAYILCCIDKGEFNNELALWAANIANNMDLNLKFLNVVEHEKHNDINLAGNIKLGEIDDMLEESALEEARQNKLAIKENRKLLTDFTNKTKKICNNNVSLLQYHGDILENIMEIKDDIKLLILGLHSNSNHLIGDNIKDIIKMANKPILLINKTYSAPKKILIAYNDSESSKKILKLISETPIFKNDIKRDIINLSNDKNKSKELLNNAISLFDKKNKINNKISLNNESAETLINYFNENKYDILAMGAFGNGVLKEIIFGSFTDKILKNINKPILLVK